MSDTYEHAISGLLRKRHDILAQMMGVRERMAVLSNDLENLDRVRETLGHNGDGTGSTVSRAG